MWSVIVRRGATLGRGFAAVVLVGLLAACGGGGGGGDGGTPVTPTPPVDTRLAWGDAALATVLNAVPTDSGGGTGGGTGGGGSATAPTSLTIHYRRTAADYTGWTLHTWDAAADTTWEAGRTPASTDSFGAVYQVPLDPGVAVGASVGYIFHQGDTKDHNNADQRWTLKAGANEIWRIQGDDTTYTSNPQGAAPPDITTVRVHYLRFDGAFANWGLHLWSGSGLDEARLPASTTIGQWANPVALNKLANYSVVNAGEAVFDIPVLNPKDAAGRSGLTFVLHGMPPNIDHKDGWDRDISVPFASLTIRNQVGEVWLVQGDPTVHTSAPDLRRASTRDARAFWLNGQLIQWPRVDGSGTVKLYHSATGQVRAPLGGAVSGHDGAVTLEVFGGNVPSALAQRFKWIDSGAVFSLRTADQARVKDLLKQQLVLVQEDAAGNVHNATTAQLPGVLDDLYAAAGDVSDLGVRISGGNTRFKLWAPTAQKAYVFTYDSATGAAVTVDEMAFDAATGVFSASRSGDLTGKYYRYAVEVFVRGTGLVRNLVTDPYSVSLTTDSRRSWIGDLGSAALKPAGWEAATVPKRVAAATDMVVYELHVRDFSASDATVSAANRGKYLAFTEATSNGMKHLKALADAGVTDVHLLPAFDIASVPEATCSTPAVPSAAADSEAQQAAVTAGASSDCFNWGYDPFHFNAPEGSYASDPSDGARRILEFRRMVMGLHAAGLRVGMDVVYNHTTASGQNDKSVLDRVVPGYYHRLTADGVVTNSTCCDNTATEHRMMAKLMVDSAVLWAREYRIASFRFDLMGHQPRAAMEELQRQVNAAVAAEGRTVQLFGEGWNFGEVVNGARFVQAAQGQLAGSGIGTFGDKLRDAVRGGGCCDSGGALVSEQGFINGLHYAPNASAGNRPLNDLRWRGDLIKGAMAGSLRDYTLLTHWDATLALKDLGNVGYATEPGEVVNYVENHDNLTLFDVNALKLPAGTSREDRARVQLLGAATVAFSQGIAYYHAGVDTLRSKSLDRNSYDSGDWFNRLDWAYADNNFGVGAPRQGDNGADWGLLKPVLADAGIKPTATEVAWMRDAFRDLMKIRASTTLLRLRSAADIQSRLSFHNLGSNQVPTVLMGRVDGNGYAGANFRELVYLINVGSSTQTVTAAPLAGKAYVLHPAHLAGADARARSAAYDPATGGFSIPARTVVAFVVP